MSSVVFNHSHNAFHTGGGVWALGGGALATGNEEQVLCPHGQLPPDGLRQEISTTLLARTNLNHAPSEDTGPGKVRCPFTSRAL